MNRDNTKQNEVTTNIKKNSIWSLMEEDGICRGEELCI